MSFAHSGIRRLIANGCVRCRLGNVLLGFFTITFGMLLGAVSPTPAAVPFILSLVWNLFNVLSWALVTYSLLPSPFHYFFSWLSPLR